MFTRNCISDSKLKPNEVKCKLIEQNRILKPQAAQAMSSFYGRQGRYVFVYMCNSTKAYVAKFIHLLCGKSPLPNTIKF